MKETQILEQSKAAYGQWAEQWRKQAKAHSKFKMKSLHDFANSGIGKAVLCIANGFSLEENIETIKANQDKVDIICCDKTLGPLLENGIIPKFCMICDANVNYKKYLEPWKDKVSGVIALMNVCANPEWSENANWKDIYFFVNKDILESEKEFCALSGCQNTIPAGTNVSNAIVVMLTQSDNHGRRNFFGYDKILLIGYDYSWRHGGKYYAFNETGDGKADYMRHIYCANHAGNFSYTSGNLAFSAQWLEKYISTFNLPVVQCSKETVLCNVKFGNLDEQMQYSFRQSDGVKVRNNIIELSQIIKRKKELEQSLAKTDKDHFLSFLASV